MVRMSLAARSVVFAIAVALAGGCAWSGTPARPRVQVPASPSIEPECAPEHGSCRGPLGAGSFNSAQFRPAFGYAVPDGWENVDDKPGFYFLLTEGPAGGGVYLFRDPYPAPADQTGPDQVINGVGRTARDLSTWLSTNPNLRTTDPAPVTLGGLTGYRLDVAIAAGVRTQPYLCAEFAKSPGDACVAVFGTAPGTPPEAWSIPAALVGPGDTIRVWMLDTADHTGTVSVWLDDFENSGKLADAFVNQAQTVVDSLRF